MVSLDCPTNEAGSINAVTYGLLQGTGRIWESEITLLGIDHPFPPLASPWWDRASVQYLTWPLGPWVVALSLPALLDAETAAHWVQAWWSLLCCAVWGHVGAILHT